MDVALGALLDTAVTREGVMYNFFLEYLSLCARGDELPNREILAAELQIILCNFLVFGPARR